MPRSSRVATKPTTAQSRKPAPARAAVKKPLATKPVATKAAPKPVAAKTPAKRVRASAKSVEPLAEVLTLPALPKPRRRSRAARAVLPVALGSLTQPGARTGDTCEECGTERVTSLALVLTDGTPVRFTSCHACEHRSWVGPEGPLDRTTVLDRTRKIR